MLGALLSAVVALGVSSGHLTAGGAPFFPVLAYY